MSISTRFVDRKPQTLCRLSAKGRKAWLAYIDHMQAMLGSAN